LEKLYPLAWYTRVGSNDAVSPFRDAAFLLFRTLKTAKFAPPGARKAPMSHCLAV